jgi:iron complex transport system substrate-binding protein
MAASHQGRLQQRIVSLAPSVTSILLAIGARRPLVAVSRWCHTVADVRGLPRLGDAWAIDTAALERMRPTLIIGSVPYRAETVAKLLELPAPFVGTNPRTLADILAEIRLLGALVGRSGGAMRLVRSMRRDFSRVSRRARHARQRPRVYAEAWPHPRISSPPWVAELVELAGGKMVVPAGCRTTDAAVRRARPDVIVLAWTAVGGRSQPAQALRNPAWQSVPAVRTGRVVAVPDHWLNTPGPPLVEGLRILFRILHPELASPRGSGRATTEAHSGEDATRG